jgi:TP901 family phage tail tape measure protein
MNDNVTVIDIVAQVTDDTASGAASATKTVSKLEQSMIKAQDEMKRMKGVSKLEIAMTLKDMASKGLQAIAEKGKNLAGKVWNITMKVTDLATAPIRGLWNLVSNPVVAMAGVAGIGLGVGDAVKTFMDFEHQMAAVAATAMLTKDEMLMLTEQAKELGASTAFSSSEVAMGMENLASAGFNARQIMAAIPGLLDLAAASGVDMANSASIAAGALNGFGLAPAEIGRVADVFAKAAAVTNAGAASMGEAMQYIAPGANAAKISLENTAAAIGVLSDANVEGSAAGTALQAILTSMTERSSEASKLIQKLGIDFYDADGRAKDFTGIVDETAKALDGMSDKQRMAALDTLFGVQASKAMNILIERSASDLDKLTRELENGEGAAKDMAAVRMDNLKGSIEELSGAFETMQLNIAAKAEPYLRSFVDWLTGKMPSVEMAVSGAMDFIAEKIDGVVVSVKNLTESSEWQNAETLWDKIKLSWNKLIAEPFEEWWNGSGKTWLAQKMNDVGHGIGSGLKAGLLTILGVDAQDAAEDGVSIGKSFMEGFLEGFDGGRIAQALKEALGNIFTDAATILPGEKTSGTAWLSAGLLTAGFAKLGGFKAAKGIFSAGSGLVGAGAGGGAAAGATAAGSLAAGGVLLGGAGFVTAISDLATAADTLNEKDRRDRTAMGLTKGGMVAAGATIGTLILPGVGTAVGAGIGGLGALLTGGPLGRFFSDLSDGTYKIEKTAEALRGVSSEAETFIEKSAATKALTEEYERLNEFLEGGKGNAQEMADAQDRLKGVTEALSGIYPGLISQYEIENGLLKDKLDLINQTSEAERKSHRLRLEQTIARGEQDFAGLTVKYEESQQNYAEFEGRRNTLIGAINELRSLETEVYAIKEQLDAAYASNNAEEAQRLSTALEDIMVPINEAASGTGYQYAHLAGFLEDMAGSKNGMVDEYNKVLDAMIKEEERMKELQEQYSAIYDAHKQIIELDLGGTFEMQAGAFAEMDKAQQDAFFNAIVKVQELEREVNLLPTEKKINIEILTGIMNASKLNAETEEPEFITVGSVRMPAPHALGGIMTRPHMGLVAEDGAEAIIPLSGKRRGRGLKIWERAGQMLGVNPYADGGIIGAVPSPSGGAGGGIQVNVEIDKALDVTIDGGGVDAAEIVQVLEDNIGNFTDGIANRIAQALTQVFANMPRESEGV